MLALLAVFNLIAIEAESIDARPRCGCTGQAWSSSLNSIVKAFAATWGQMDLLRRRSFKNSRALTKQSSCWLAAAISDKTSFSSWNLENYFRRAYLVTFCTNIQMQFKQIIHRKVINLNFCAKIVISLVPFFVKFFLAFSKTYICFYSVWRLLLFRPCSPQCILKNVWRRSRRGRTKKSSTTSTPNENFRAAFVNEGQNATELNLRRSSNSVFEVTTKVAPHIAQKWAHIMRVRTQQQQAAAVLERVKKMGNRELKWQMSKNNEEGMQDFCNNERVP